MIRELKTLGKKNSCEPEIIKSAVPNTGSDAFNPGNRVKSSKVKAGQSTNTRPMQNNEVLINFVFTK